MVWCVPLRSMPYVLLLFLAHYILFCSVLWNGSSKGVSTSCCLSPHLFSVPVKLGNILYMFPYLPHCSFSEVCTFTLISPSVPAPPGNKGWVQTNKRGKKKEENDLSLLTLFPSFCHSFFFPFVLSSKSLNEMHTPQPVSVSPGLKLYWFHLAIWQTLLRDASGAD